MGIYLCTARRKLNVKKQNFYNKVAWRFTRGIKRTYIKHRVWHLGGRKRQKEGVWSIIWTLAKPLLVSEAGAISGEFLQGIAKKNICGKKAVEKEEGKYVRMPRNNILLQSLQNSRRVQLPNDCVFFTKYERVNTHAVAPIQNYEDVCWKSWTHGKKN